MAVLGYLPKLKGDLGLAFGPHFLHDFPIKNVFYLILYEQAKFQCHTSFENEKSFLDEIKNIFHSFWRAIIWLKITNWWKIADTNFNFDIYLLSQFTVISISSENIISPSGYAFFLKIKYFWKWSIRLDRPDYFSLLAWNQS